MHLFLFQRILNCRIVAACVFWGLILSNLELCDGEVREGEYGTFYDHYGDNLEGLTPGDVFEKEKAGGLILIYDKEQYFQMHTGRVEANQRDVTCHLYTYPKKGQAMRRLKKVQRAPYYYPTIALIDNFLMKHLPFHWNYCNKYDYMNYLVYGQTTRNENFKECPLAAPWVGWSERDIRTFQLFKLKDGYGIEHDFTDYRVPIQGGGAESSTQGSGSGSSKQLDRSDSELKRVSSFDRIVKDPFKKLSGKRGRSV